MNIAGDHLANLAKLSLSEKEKKRFEADLAGILAYVDQLQEVETNGIAEITPASPTSQGGHAAPEINQLREDGPPRAHNEKEVAALRDALPAREEAYARVPLVINKK